ncbi:MAG: hypothetical protein E6G59_01250 [Actinobacteria bacterium]|nr:MAG: hypothetical protein E6G59_01250 [Actinomycetota bacterium]
MGVAEDTYWERLAAVSGLAGLALTVVGTFIVGSPPAADATMERIRTYFADNRTGLLVQMLLYGLAAAALLAFVGGLRSYLRRYEGSSGLLSGITFGGGVTLAILILLGLFLEIGIVYRVASTADDALVRVIFDAITTSAVFFGFPIAVFVGAACVIARRTGAFSKGIYWLGIFVILANLAGAGELFIDSGPWTPGGSATFIPFGLLVVWEVAVAITMISRAGRDQQRLAD